MTQREQQILDWITEDPMISQEALAERAGITRSSVAVHISNLMKKGHIVGRGYILPAGGYVVVAGAVNVDIGGQSAGPLVGRDSNPGKVTVSMGGVGRNIAHNLRLLGVKVSLLTALGEDPHAGQVMDSCERLGIDLSRALHVPGGTTSTYLFLSDETGDMALAVSDMGIYEELTPAYFARHQGYLNGAALVVADANLPAGALAYLADHCTAPLLVDPVSTVKAEKVRPILGKLHTLKPNRMEAESLSGMKITDRASARRAAEKLLETGLERVFISLGEEGVLPPITNGTCGSRAVLPRCTAPPGQGMPLLQPWDGHSWRERTWLTAPGPPTPRRPSRWKEKKPSIPHSPRTRYSSGCKNRRKEYESVS